MTQEMGIIEKALVTATAAHQGQVDKTGYPFIMHPVRVAARLGATAPEYLVAAALLHDVVEDTSLTLDDLAAAGFPDKTIYLVDVMTRQNDETYKEYIQRVGRHPAAIPLKLADLSDNMDPNRATTPMLRGMIKNRYEESVTFLERIQRQYLYLQI